MSSDWDTKIVISGKRTVPKVAKKESEINGTFLLVFRAVRGPDYFLSAARRSGAIVSTDKKSTVGNKAHVSTDHARIAKIDRENEVAPPSTVAPSVGRAIQTARLGLSLTQKDLAAKVNEKASVIQDYESAKAIPSPQLLSKLERALGVRLRGSAIGQKLESKKT